MEMARPISDEELQLRKRARRRLIGAIAIVTAVVVALPMVLDNEPKPLNQEIDIRIPSQDSAEPFISKVVPLPDAAQTPGKPAATPAPEAKPEAQAPPPPGAPGPKPQSAAAAEEKSAPVKKPDPPAPGAKSAAKTASIAKPEPPAAKPAAPSGQYVVQVVALSDAAKASQMQQAILKTGVKAYTEVVKTARGDVTRVRVGPYATRDAAEKAQQKLKGAGFDGKVVPAR